MIRCAHLALSLAIGLLALVPQVARAGQPSYSSARALLLSQRLLPAHYIYKNARVQDSVAAWDSNIRQIMVIDEQNGWFQGARELASDTRGHAVHVTVQLFRNPAGARADFAQFFTNDHPETIYNPSAQWLGGFRIGGLGKPATIYRYSDTGAGCPQSLVTGITYVYGNALISVEACLHTAGERGVTDLAGRLLRHARMIARHSS
ncbi:MAG: hypothetical protein NVS2B16_13380 [Chloroflexota bacterium]